MRQGHKRLQEPESEVKQPKLNYHKTVLSPIRLHGDLQLSEMTPSMCIQNVLLSNLACHRARGSTTTSFTYQRQSAALRRCSMRIKNSLTSIKMAVTP